MKFAVVCVALVLASCAKPREPLATLGTVPDFTLTSQTGETFQSASQLDGKVWLADFFFTSCPGPCPRMTSQMRQVQKAVSGLPDVRFVSFTVDPAHDTPQVLAAYAKKFSAGPGWYFLTGAPEDLNRLSFDTFHLNKVDGQLEHSTRFVLVDREGRVRKYYMTLLDFSVPDLVEDVRSLVEEHAG